jgi:Tol biopolymer transport system component
MGENPRRLANDGFNPAWSPDGSSIVYAAQRVTEPEIRGGLSELWVVAVNDLDAEPWRLTADDAMQPVWSPNGSRIAFWGAPGGQRDLFTIAATGGETVAVTDDAAVDWSPVWSPDGRHLYFASDRGGAMSLWRIAINEATGVPLGEPEAVTFGSQAEASRPSLSKDGRRLVFRSRLQSINPAVMAFDPDTETLAEPRFLFQQTGVRTLSSISPDGEWLAYGNVGEHQEDLFVSRSNGSDMRRVNNDADKDRNPTWAPDSERLVFYSNRSGSYEVWTIRQDGSDLTQVSDDPNVNYTSSLYSPLNDQIIAIAFNLGAVHVFDATAEAARSPVEVLEPPDGRFTPWSISPDGSRLAGQWDGRPDGDSVLAFYNLVTGTWRRTVEWTGAAPKWLPDGNRVLYRSSPDLITLLDVETGRQQPLGRLPYDVEPGLAVAPDGRAVYVSVRSTASDIWMLERAR